MKSNLCSFLLLLSVIYIDAEPSKLCTNGVFKCVSPTSLRICFLDNLVSSEFFCPNSTFCNENSPAICTRLPTALPAIQYFEDSETTETQCSESGIFEVENTGCTTYLNCSNLEEDEESECNETSLFNPETKTCDEDFICPEILEYFQSPGDCSVTAISFNCTKVGSFFLPNTNCEKFIYCKRINIGLKPILKFCPTNALFDPKSGKCVKGHICSDECATTPDPITTTPFQESNSTLEQTTPEDTSDPPNPPECPDIGKFPLPNTNCTMYRLCTNTSMGMLHKDYTCPLGSYFNPSTKKCSSKYECWPHTTTQETTTSHSDQDTTTPNPITVETTTSKDLTPNSTDTQDTTTPVDSSSPNMPELSTTSTTTDSLCTSTPKGSTDDQDTTTQRDVTQDISPSIPEVSDDPNSSISADPDDTTTFSTPTNTQDTSTNSTEDITTQEDDTSPELSTTSTANTITVETDVTDDGSLSSTINSNSEDSTSDQDTTTQRDDPNSSISVDPEYTTTFSTPTNTQDTSTNSTEDLEPTTITPDENELTTPSIDCRSQGRLPVLNTKCKMYYQCTLTTNGYIYEMFECSKGTLFDPYKKICLESYICSENVPDTTTDKIISTPEDTTSEEIALNCTQQGKIPIPNTNCILYGQCTLTTSGFFESIFECPEGTFYDPEMKLCSTSYICPETISSTTVIIPSTESSVPSCTVQGNLPILNTKCKNYLSCILTTNGFKSTEYVCSGNLLFDPNLKKCSSNYVCTEETAHIPKDPTPSTIPDLSTCTENGKFPVPHSKCSQYIICSSTQNGFISKILTCPVNSFYDPENKKCSQTYVCSELDPEDLDTPECHNTGKFSLDNTGCSKYILCTLTSTGFKSKIYSCPIDSYFNPYLKRCQKDYSCPEETTTEHYSSEESSEECVKALKELPVCTKSGKFPISGINCKQYLLCTQTSLGFRSKVYDCPNDSNFDPDKKKCTVSYSCTEKICGTENGKAVKIIKAPIISKCKYPGKFLVKGTNCKKFKLCVWTNLGYTKTVYDCPEGTYFDQRLQLCSENYICTEDKVYNCTTIGQFQDSSDTTCQYYINCKANPDGTVRGEQKQCPKDYYFDPVIQKCSAYYMCKEKKFARIVEKTPKFFVNDECTTVGRYAINGTNCKKYMYCADNGDGTLKGTQFTCPTTSVFNQVIQKCTATYICPDSVCRSIGLVANPNSKDCTSYIKCEDIYDPEIGLVVGYTGTVVFCPPGQKFDQKHECCSPKYVCLQ